VYAVTREHVPFFLGFSVSLVFAGVAHAELVEAVKALEKLPAKGATTKAAHYYGGAEVCMA
jgi:hypothetical protein